MINNLLLVSTCGTSLLTNNASETDRSWLNKIANEPIIDQVKLTPIINERRERLAKADAATRCKMSAELNGIHAVINRWKPQKINHIIIHTDTALGKATAELVQENLAEAATFLSAGGLRTDHLASFRTALADLTKELDETIQGYRRAGWFVVFNLTGGFKSLNGYLQTLGMISADRCVFLFEGASDLMEIPRLPVRVAEEDELRKHLTVFRRLSVGYPVRVEDAMDIPEALLMEMDGQIIRSVLGDVAWVRHRSILLAESLLQPLSGKVRLTEAVRRSFNDLEDRQKVQVNEALDEFCAYVDGTRSMTKSRTFKKLQGNPYPGSTHELYLWSDGATGRMFGHYEDKDNFILDRLVAGNHL